jgi:kanamycin kinase
MAPAGQPCRVAWRAETARIAGAAVIGAVTGWAISWDLDWSVAAGQRECAQASGLSDRQPVSTARVLELLAGVPPIDRLVVCHGDSCALNTLLAADGRWSAHVDLGALGVADRWADLAIATWKRPAGY